MYELKQKYEGPQGMGMGFEKMSTIRFVERMKDDRMFEGGRSGSGGELLGGDFDPGIGGGSF